MTTVRRIIPPGQPSSPDGILQGGSSIHHRQTIVGGDPGHMRPTAVPVLHAYQQQAYRRFFRQLQKHPDQTFKAADAFRRLGVVDAVLHHH